MTKARNVFEADLRQFTGSEKWYRHCLNRDVFFTEGAKYVADKGAAYWLLDAIALCQRYEKAVAATRFQVWRLVVHPDRTATLTCDNGKNKTVYTQQMEFTDFPLDEISLWFTDYTIYLPSEH